MNTTERLRQIANEWYCGTERSPAPLVEQIADEFVLIPRAEIPAASIEGEKIIIPGSPSWRMGSHTSARLYREAALYISRAEALEKHEEAAKAAEVAADNAKLDAEALALFNAERAGNGWGPLPDILVSPAKWRTLALAAREIHGVTQ